MNLKSILKEGSSHTARLSEATRALAGKWEKTGLLEGITSEVEKAGVATLLENQARQLVKEASSTGTSANSEEWAGVALPLVRRIFSEIVAKDFVSVQPMNLPAGLVFFMDFKYANTVNGKTAGTSLYGTTSGSGVLPRGGFYGAGEYAYSVNDATLTLAPAIGSGSAVGYGDVNYNDTYSSSFASFFKFVVPAVSFSNADFNAVRSFRVTTNVAGGALLPEFTKYDGTNVTLIVSGT